MNADFEMADFHFNFDYRDNEDLMMKAACILGRVRFLVKLHKPVLAFRQVENDSRSLLVPLAQYTARVLQGIANSLYLWWQGLAHGAHTQPPPFRSHPPTAGQGRAVRSAATLRILPTLWLLWLWGIVVCGFAILWLCGLVPLQPHQFIAYAFLWQHCHCVFLWFLKQFVALRLYLY